MTKQVVLRMVPSTAIIVGHTLDGALDAGACADGLTPRETSALLSVHSDILRQTSGVKIPLDDDPIVAIAAFIDEFDRGAVTDATMERLRLLAEEARP